MGSSIKVKLWKFWMVPRKDFPSMVITRLSGFIFLEFETTVIVSEIPLIHNAFSGAV